MPFPMPPLERKSPHELSGVIVLPEVNDELNLVVESVQAAPALEQVNALSQVIAAWLGQRKSVETALFAFYRGTALATTETGPEIAVATDVWGAVTFSELRLVDLRHAPAGAV